MVGADGGRGRDHPSIAGQVTQGQDARQKLSARIEAAMAQRMAQREEDDRQALATHLAMRESTLGSVSGGLTSRLRASLGSQPLGAMAVCQVHRWHARGQGLGRVCADCGLKSGE